MNHKPSTVFRWMLLFALSLTTSIASAQSPVPATPIGVNDAVSIESASFPAPTINSLEVPQSNQSSDSSSDNLIGTETLESLLGGQSDSMTSPESLPFIDQTGRCSGRAFVSSSDHFDDDLLRPRDRRFDFATTGVWRSANATDSSPHGALLVRDAAGDGSGVAANQNRCH